MRIDLSREAQADINAAADWYIEQGVFSAALDFSDEVDRALRVLGQYPGIGAPGSGVMRMRPLQDFPYTLVYRVMPDHVRVIAVAHHSRRPGYWRGRR